MHSGLNGIDISEIPNKIKSDKKDCEPIQDDSQQIKDLKSVLEQLLNVNRIFYEVFNKV
jgi:hypothetical protein